MDDPLLFPLDAGHARQNFSRISRWWIWIVLLFVVWQPLELGFYMDDWATDVTAARHGAAFSAQRLQFILALDPTRPGIVVPRFILSSLLGDRPLLWQLTMLLANCLVAVALAHAAQVIAGTQSGGGAVAFGLAWLILPWSTSNQFWTVLLPVELLLGLFAVLLTSAVKRHSPTIAMSVIQALIYLWLCTSYEIFYGQFLAIVLLVGGMVAFRRVEARAAVWSLVSLGAGQGMALLWYFVSPKWIAHYGGAGGAQRPIEHGWLKSAEANFIQLLPQMVISMTELRWPFYLLMLALLVSSGYVLWMSRRKWATGRQVLGAALILGACALGAILSVVCLSLGARQLSGIGVDNRAFMLVSFWLVLLAALSALTVVRFASPMSRRILAGLALACGILLGSAHTLRASDWASAWSQQNQILQRAPVEQLRRAEPSATVILVNPLTVNGAPIFSAPWDINSALPLTYPFLGGHRVTIYSLWLGPMIWDGDKLMYAGGSPIAQTHDVYLWIPSDNSFRRATRAFQIAQDLSVRDLP